MVSFVGFTVTVPVVLFDVVIVALSVTLVMVTGVPLSVCQLSVTASPEVVMTDLFALRNVQDEAGGVVVSFTVTVQCTLFVSLGTDA